MTAWTCRRSAPYSPIFCGVPTPRKCVGEIGRHVVVGGEPQAAGSQVISQQLSQAGFVERNVTPGELGDLTGIDIDPDDLVSQLRHTDGVGGTQIPSAEDAASHTTVCRWLR